MKYIPIILLFAVLVAGQKPKHRVVNGHQVGNLESGQVRNPGTFPYIAHIRILRISRKYINATNTFRTRRHTGRCVGSIIRNNAVLTASHCLYGTQPQNISVSAGIVHLYASQPTRQTLNAKRLVLNEKFKGNWENDIAFIFLKGRFTFNDFVKPINIAQPSDYKIGMELVGAGWGRDFNGTLISWLNSADLILLNNSYCQQYSRRNFAGLLCTIDGQVTTKVCAGDSGGPLVKGDILVGILNGGLDFNYPGKPNRGECDPYFPTIYTNLSYYSNWITKTLSLEP